MISFRFAELNPLTRGFGGVSSGWMKYAVTPATLSHAPLLLRKDKQCVAGFGLFPKQEASFRQFKPFFWQPVVVCLQFGRVF